jgi:N-acetylglutamate synthase-like GNAT family acetyltransferase
VIELRPAESRDAEDIARIYIRAWNDGFGHLLGVREFTPETVVRWRRDLVEGAAQFTVAEIDDEMVGIVGVGPSRDPIDPALGELDTIAVDPDRWRIGIGGCLMEHALETLRRSWAKAILWTPADYDRGHAFYVATGWVPLGLTRSEGTQVAFGRDL